MKEHEVSSSTVSLAFLPVTQELTHLHFWFAGRKKQLWLAIKQNQQQHEFDLKTEAREFSKERRMNSSEWKAQIGYISRLLMLYLAWSFHVGAWKSKGLLEQSK